MKINKLYLFPLSLVFLEIGTYLSTDAYLPALPSISNNLNTTAAMAQLSITSWFLGGVCIQLFLGPIADRYGRKPLVLYGAILFALSSLFCAYTDNIIYLIIARFFQGCTVASTITGGYAAIHESFSSKQAIKILALMGSITIIAPAIGPTAGAAILSITDNNWRWIFLILGIWGVLASGLIYNNMQETLNNPTPINLKNTLRSYKTILTNLIWLRYAIMSASLIFGFFVWLVSSPFLLINFYNFSALEFGLAQTCIFSGFILGMQCCKKLIDLYPLKTIMQSFLIINTIGISILLAKTWIFTTTPAWFLITLMTVVAFGASGVNTPLSRLAIEASKAPMGQKVAMFSLIFTIAATLASFIGSIINPLQSTAIFYTCAVGYLVAISFFIINYNNIKLEQPD